jgi:sugar lactone lactonase YvrE
MAHKPTVLAEGFLFPETPRWHKARGRFLITDIDRGQVIEISADGSKKVVYQAPDWVSGTAFVDEHTLVVTHALKRDLVHVDLRKPEAVPFARLAALATYGINDMIRTAAGYCFVDTVDFDFGAYSRGQAEAKPSALIRVAPDGSASIATREVNFPNGLAISPDGGALYVGDSLDECVYEFPLSPDGTLGGRRLFASLPGEAPDGISLDQSGAIWVATKHRVLRVAKGGAILEEVDMGTTAATACMLGGDDGRTLLITASDSHDRSIISQNPSGRVFQVKVSVPGIGLPSIY